jgi:ribosomal protein S18 acetylase RimI-like enzyme
MGVVPAGGLTFLVDSNVFITLEPHVTHGDTEPFDLAARFVRLVQDHGHRLAVHEGTIEDIERDQDVVRRAHSRQALKKYRLIEDIPVSERISDAIPGSSPNDLVDAAIASTLDAQAAHFLVTEDQRLRRRVQSAAPDLADRVLSLSEAVEYLDWLDPAPKPPPPLVERVHCYHVSLDDPIFESIRADYDGFDRWFREACQASHREAFVINGENGGLAGLCIIKDEDDREYGLPRRRLKLCTLKVAEPYRGQRLGELLIKAALDDAVERRRSGLSITVFDHHVELIGLLDDLGFVKCAPQTGLGELVYFRSVEPPPGAVDRHEPFEFNRRYGPRSMNLEVPMHVIPIKPRWEERLFPEGRTQLDLLRQAVACGNGLRKAYLSRSLNRRVSRGDIVLFYRSTDMQAVRFIGVVEGTRATSDYLELGKFVGTRTVYTAKEIEEMTQNGAHEVNAILMWQARQVEPEWHLTELISNKVFAKPPQSIQAVPEEGAEWVRSRLAA